MPAESQSALDAAQARIAARLDETRLKVQSAIAGTELESLLPMLRDTFQARLVWLQVGDTELGRKPDEHNLFTPSLPPVPLRRKGKAAVFRKASGLTG